MTPAERNKRLYDYLAGLGLYVRVVPKPGSDTAIDAVVVSVQEPEVELTPLDVRPPLEGPEVGEVVAPTEPHLENVIDFPTER